MKKKVFLVYGGPIDDTHHRYFVLDELSQNDGTSIYDLLGIRQASLSKSIVKQIGVIFEAETEGDVFYFAKNPTYKGVWANQDDRAKWQLKRTAVETEKALKNKAGKNDLYEVLMPLKDVYRGSSPVEKRIMLSEIIRIITSGSAF